ncbi:MAG TPA: transglycosylase SLT domain-containing protein [Bryobacteraceae bacterium]|nr:transglycosylase SLT domain-containing protein [Bryobacteraceae bacterium]
MTNWHNYSWLGSLSVALILVTGCSSIRSQQFGLQFLPPTPKAASTPIVTPLPDAPKIQPNIFLSPSESPTFLHGVAISAESSAATLRIQRANARFEAGKAAYQAGDTETARMEFDRAVEILLSAPAKMSERSRIEMRLEAMISAIHRFDMNGLGAADLAGQSGYDKAPLEDILDSTFPVDPSLKPRVREQLTATKSGIPLVLNDAVLSYINFFQSDRGRATLLAGLRRAGRYRHLIARILEEEGVPQELIYLAQAESGFLPRAVSYKAAVGMWQFIQSRGREYGLMQTSHTDDRLDPEKATRSAARHLKDLYDQFGDWYLAIAAYNCGPGGVERAVERTGYADFWQLRSRNALPRETTNYVPIIVAMTIMAKNAKEYGLENIEIDPPLEYETIQLETPTHMALIADACERPVSEIRELNPSLLSAVAPSAFEIRVPKGSRDLVLAGLQAVPPAMRNAYRLHRVSSGETLATIAKRYQTSERTIANANGQLSTDIGEVLLIPTGSQGRPKAAVRSTYTSSTRRAAGKTSAAGNTPAKRTKAAQAPRPAVKKSGKLVAASR